MGQDCKYCGAYIAKSADKCPACGKRINYKADAEGRTAGGYAAYQTRTEQNDYARENVDSGNAGTYSYTYNYSSNYSSDQSSKKNYGAENDSRCYYKAAEATGESMTDDDAKANQLVSFLSYFGLLFLVPYLLRPNSRFARFHANQGLVLLLTSAAINILAGFVPVFGWLFEIAGALFVFVCFLKGIINVYRLEKKELPLIGGIRILK